jgi:DNA-binding protein
MKSFNSGNTYGQQQQRWQEGNNNTRATDARGNYSYYSSSNKVETQLLPNEFRISNKGNFGLYIRQILSTLESGYANCKIVARGTATQFAYDVVEEVKNKLPARKFFVKESETTALNKRGHVVQELHFMISMREQEQQ